MTSPVYILIRSSNRPVFFKRMMETIKHQTYKNIVTIIHTDDPRDKYIEGDIIVKGSAYGKSYGDGTYNLYFNRLLESIPDEQGWIHFMDDDDEYAAPDVIEKFVANSKQNELNVARVMRWDEKIFPKLWGRQTSFQTECFLLHTDHRKKAQWWGNKNGDHNYSKKLTKQMPINWIDDLLICKLQECKGHGKRLDKNGEKTDYKNVFKPDDKVTVIGMRSYIHPTEYRVKENELKNIPYRVALQLEEKELVKITYPDLHLVSKRVKFNI